MATNLNNVRVQNSVRYQIMCNDASQDTADLLVISLQPLQAIRQLLSSGHLIVGTEAMRLALD